MTAVSLRLHEAARRYLGVPFRHCGRDPRIGLDCIGLVVLALRDCGHVVHDRSDYARNPHGEQLEAALHAHFGQPAVGLRPDDVVSMRFAGRRPRHVAIVGCTDYGSGEVLTVIHTDAMIGRVVEHRLDEAWRARIVHAYRSAS